MVELSKTTINFNSSLHGKLKLEINTNHCHRYECESKEEKNQMTSSDVNCYDGYTNHKMKNYAAHILLYINQGRIEMLTIRVFAISRNTNSPKKGLEYKVE